MSGCENDKCNCKCDNSGKFAAGAIFGAIAGAIAGLVLAPKTGKETREGIKINGEKAFKKAKCEGEKAFEKAKSEGKKIADKLNKDKTEEVEESKDAE